jgi:eukaryotic-like serine/threonine-protein kinase
VVPDDDLDGHANELRGAVGVGAGTSRVVARLADELRDLPLLILATARDDEGSLALTDALVARLGPAVDIDLTLGPLDEAGVAELVRSQIPGLSTTGPLVGLLTARARGIPFVTHEYLRAIVDAGLLRPNWGSWQLDEAGLDALELPSDALGLVLARVDGLGPAAHDVLVTAAVAGTRFRPEVVAVALERDPVGVLDVLVEAAGRGLVEQRHDSGYAFLHDRIREALLERLPLDEESRQHARIGAALEALPVPAQRRPAERVFEIAHHYVAAGPGFQPAGRYRPARQVANWPCARTPRPPRYRCSNTRSPAAIGRTATCSTRSVPRRTRPAGSTKPVPGSTRPSPSSPSRGDGR